MEVEAIIHVVLRCSPLVASVIVDTRAEFGEFEVDGVNNKINVCPRQFPLSECRAVALPCLAGTVNGL